MRHRRWFPSPVPGVLTRTPGTGAATTGIAAVPERAVGVWHHPLTWILVVGAVLRLAILLVLGDVSLQADELQYQELATNLTEGRGFSLSGRATSWRPPFYPFVLAALYTLVGTTTPLVARVFQAVLSLVNCFLVYWLGRRLFGVRTALGGALVFALYPSLLFYNQHLLTEVLFTFLLTLTGCGLLAYLQAPRASVLVATGIVFALTVLTREIVWPLVVLVILLAGWATRPFVSRWGVHAVAFLLAFLLPIVPWVVRNTVVQGSFTSIATNGGLVFYEGNYEHTPADRPWRAHTLPSGLKVRQLLPQGLSESERQKVAFRRGLDFIRRHPGLTAHRAVVKAANVWGLDRGIVGAMLKGTYGPVGRTTLLGVLFVISAAYAATALAGVTGLAVSLADSRGAAGAFHAFVVGLFLWTTVAHALAFGHPRYHLPLVPFLGLYAVHAWATRRAIWERRRSWAVALAAVLVLLLVAVWLREVFVVEFGRIGGALATR